MQLSDFSFDLPDELIARYPLESRSASRLLHIDVQGHYHDHVFTDILDLLEDGDLLVLNDTKVMKARLKGKRATGGAIEVLVERMLIPTPPTATLSQATHLKAGAELYIGEDAIPVTVQGRHETCLSLSFHNQFCQYWINTVSYQSPPYFNREAEEIDTERYQTVFHDPEKLPVLPQPQSLHFDQGLLEN